MNNLIFIFLTSYAVGENPRAFVIYDINLDGKPDVITANTGANTISVLLNTYHPFCPTTTTTSTASTTSSPITTSTISTITTISTSAITPTSTTSTITTSHSTTSTYHYQF